MILAIILAAANAYLGLRLGTTGVFPPGVYAVIERLRHELASLHEDGAP